MRKMMVIGASGGMGHALVYELMKRGIDVIAFSRNEEKLHSLFSMYQHVKIYKGDARSLHDLQKASEDVDVIFHALNVPYPQWSNELPTIMKNILLVAKQKGSKLVLVDNIYAYGKGNNIMIPENYPKNPHTKKGSLRLELETLVKESGVPAIIAHLPDFYGPYAENTLLNYTLNAMAQNKWALFIGNQNIKREYIYLPDGAKALIKLALHEAAYGQNWNIPGTDVITGKELITIAKRYTGYSKNVYTISKNLIRLVGFFDPMMKEYVEMFYLNEEPLVLSGKKYEQEIGHIPATTYEEGIRQTINYFLMKQEKH